MFAGFAKKKVSLVSELHEKIYEIKVFGEIKCFFEIFNKLKRLKVRSKSSLEPIEVF